ncbi:Uu.00g135710.m01.CDS01 [Anthostomella pinea]|uniref:Uu.00g135710.m01.CDS01 n=1 Tax=Anthostomella pinea TaxID=933095 RepID=A0AAI8VP54_9PEZI|nr:Uu.00g135710.m01.CDS01 [Anthostomella pinea]
MPIDLPTEFTESYLIYQKYPRYIAASSTYGPALWGFRERLNRKKAKLFIQDAGDIVVPVREIQKRNGAFTVSKCNILSEEKLKEWLGDTYERDPNNPAKFVGALATKADPNCRFIFLITDSALAPLELTRDCLLRILTYHQVMPNYIDFLLVYGAQEEDRELRFSGFRTRTTFVNPEPGHIIPDLGRSGRQHEMCYNLKAVAPREAGKTQLIQNRWKIRQAAIYHRFDLGTGSLLWIIADPREAVKGVIGEILPEGTAPRDFQFGTVAEAFSASLDTHILLAQWASDEWRWHIQSLEETIDNMTRPALLFDDGNQYQPRVLPRAVTRVQEYEDKVNEAVMVMESNINILTSLRSSYKTLVEDPEFPAADQGACQKAFKRFTTRMDEFIFDLRTQTDRGKVLSKLAADRKAIVLGQTQMQAATKQEKLAESMWQFAERGQKEAIAMRTVTIITLLYLPPTFVSTFFSTDVIKYQDNGTDQVFFSRNAMISFLYVTIPLWAVTLVVVVFYYKWESWRREQRARGLLSQDPDVFEYWEKYSRSSGNSGSQKMPNSFIGHILGKGQKQAP